MKARLAAVYAACFGEGAARGATISLLAYVVLALLSAGFWYSGIRPSTNVSMPREFALVLAFGAIALGTLPVALLGAIAGSMAQARRSAGIGIGVGLLGACLIIGLWWAREALQNPFDAPVPFPLQALAILSAAATLGGGLVGWRAATASAAPHARTFARTFARIERATRAGTRVRSKPIPAQLLHRAHDPVARKALLLPAAAALALFSFGMQTAVPDFHVAGGDPAMLPSLLRLGAQPWLWLFGLLCPLDSTFAFRAWSVVGAIGFGINAAVVGAALAAWSESRQSVA
jgi:hypothetical protein